MPPIPPKTKENSLYLITKQKDFDAILNGTKNREYRDISTNTVTKYLEYQVVDGEVQLLYYPDLLSEDKLALYANDIMYYNNGVYPYAAKDIWYLDLAVGHAKDRNTMTVVVEDISFEPEKDEGGGDARVSFDQQDRPYEDANGDFTLWNIVFHLGEVVRVNGQLTMDN